jgi:hypothetical protein
MRRPAARAARQLLLLIATLTLCAVSMIVAGPRGGYDTLFSVFLGLIWCAVLFWLLDFNWYWILKPGRFRGIAVMTCSAGVFCAVISGLAAPALALKWRGERQVVTVVSRSGEATRLRSNAITEYRYQLVTSTGHAVRPDLLDSSGSFHVGDRLSVTTDPWGLIQPVLDDEVTALPAELIALGIGFVAVITGGFALLRLDPDHPDRGHKVAAEDLA